MLEISDHAVLQHLKRSGGILSRENRIRRIVAFGEQIEPKNKLQKLLNNKFKEAKYYCYGCWIAVVVDETVVTVYKYNPNDWV